MSPCVAVDRGLDRTVMHALDGDAVCQAVERLLADPAIGADPIAPEPARCRQLQMPRQRAVIGEEQQPLRGEVEPSHRDHAGEVGWQSLEHGRPPLRVLVARHQALWLVITPQPRRLGLRQRLAVDLHFVAGRQDMGRRGQHLAVHADAALLDPPLGIPPRAEPGMGDCLGDPHRLSLLGCRSIRGDLSRRLTLARVAAQFRFHEREACRSAASRQAALADGPGAVEAEAARDRGEVPIGAVIASASGEILASAGNRTLELKDPTAHAELLAIREACAKIGSERLDRLRSLCDARALRHVRRRDFLRAHPSALFRRARSERRRR